MPKGSFPQVLQLSIPFLLLSRRTPLKFRGWSKFINGKKPSTRGKSIVTRKKSLIHIQKSGHPLKSIKMRSRESLKTMRAKPTPKNGPAKMKHLLVKELIWPHSN
jgi:hypothetical protein